MSVGWLVGWLVTLIQILFGEYFLVVESPSLIVFNNLYQKSSPNMNRFKITFRTLFSLEPTSTNSIVSRISKTSWACWGWSNKVQGSYFRESKNMWDEWPEVVMSVMIHHGISVIILYWLYLGWNCKMKNKIPDRQAECLMQFHANCVNFSRLISSMSAYT